MMKSQTGQKELNKILQQSQETVEGESNIYGGHAGCTATTVFITPNEIYCANAGDSRTVLSRDNGIAMDLSVDHKPDDPQEKARIEGASGFVEENRVNGQLGLSRALGDFDFKKNIMLKPEM